MTGAKTTSQIHEFNGVNHPPDLTKTRILGTALAIRLAAANSSAHPPSRQDAMSLIRARGDRYRVIKSHGIGGRAVMAIEDGNAEFRFQNVQNCTVTSSVLRYSSAVEIVHSILVDTLEEQMHPIRSLLAVTGAILAFAVLAPPASQAAPTAFAPLTVSKECSEFTGSVPSFCTIIDSNFQALIKTHVRYYGPALGSNGQFVSSTVVLDAGPGSGSNAGTALGHCIVYIAAGPAGMCSFNGGDGALAGFRAIVKVTVDMDGIWHWEGVESHGN